MRELSLTVHTHDLARIVGRHRSHKSSFAERQLHQIGQVEFAPGSWPEHRQALPEPVRFEGQQPAINLANRKGRLVGLGLLDDAEDVAGRVARDPSVACSVVQLGRQQRHTGLIERRDQRPGGLESKEWRVAIEYQHSLRSTGELLAGLQHGVTSATLLALLDDGDVPASGPHGRLIGSNHDHRRGRVELPSQC